MAYTLNQSIAWAQSFVQFSPLTAGTGNEPALSTANMVQNTVMNAPFTWPWNRNQNSATSTVQGTQDYTFSLTDFNFLEKASLTDANNKIWEIKDVYNTQALTISSEQARPNAACISSLTQGTSFSLRFMAVPNAVYTVNLVYQKLPTPFSTPSGNWSIPDTYIDIYNNLFLGEMFALADDARSTQYRQRGIAALLSKAEGLSEMDRNLFLDQYWARDSQQTARQLRTQQAAQARAI